MQMSEQPGELRSLLESGLAMLDQGSTVEQWKSLWWDICRGVRTHIVSLRAETEPTASENNRLL
jgi:hypothetical protein